MNRRQLFKEGYKAGYKKALNKAKNNNSLYSQHDDLTPTLITNKIAKDSFERMIINLLICILKDQQDDQERSLKYHKLLNTPEKEDKYTLITLVRRLIKRNVTAVHDVVEKVFEKAKEMTVYGKMKDYWADKYQVSIFLVDDWIERNRAYLIEELIHTLFNRKK